MPFITPSQIQSPSLPFASKSFNSGPSFDQILEEPTNPVASLAQFALGSVADIPDTISASVGLTDRGEITSGVGEAFFGEQFVPFFERNRGAIELASGVAQIFGAVKLVGAVTKTGSTLNSIIRQIPGGRLITSSNKLVNVRLNQLFKIEQGLANEGAAGFSDFMMNLSRKQAVNRVQVAALRKGATEGALVEGILAITANENEFLWTDDMGVNLFYIALGIAIPSTVEVMFVNHRNRKFLNSDAMNCRAFQACDVGSWGARREASALQLNEITRNLNISPHGHRTDNATDYFLASQAKKSTVANDGISTQLETVRQKAATEDFDLGLKEIGRVLSDGIPGSTSKVALGVDSSILQHMRVVARTDPTAFYGIEYAGKLTKSPDDIVVGFNDQIARWRSEAEKLIKSDDPIKKARGQDLMLKAASHDGFVPIAFHDLERIPLEEMRGLENPYRGGIATESVDDLTIYKLADKNIAIDNNLRLLRMPRGRNVNTLTYTESTGLYQAAKRAITGVSTRNDPTIILSKNPNWFQLDAAEYAQRTFPQIKVRYPKGLDRESAQLESLAQKFDALKGSINDVTRNRALQRSQFNLPKVSSAERVISQTDDSALETYFRGLVESGKGAGDIRKTNISELKRVTQEYKEASDLLEFSDKEFDLLGGSFSIGLDLEGKTIEPFVAFIRPIQPDFFNRDSLGLRLATHQSIVVQTLTNDFETLVGKLSRAQINSPDFKNAGSISKLHEAQLSSTVPGRANFPAQTTLTHQDFTFRDNPILQSALRIEAEESRLINAHIQERLDTIKIDDSLLSNIFADLRVRKGSNQLLNQFITARRGFVDINPSAVELSRGTEAVRYGFKVENTERNRIKWHQLFKEDMPTNAMLQDAKGNIVRVDDLGLKGIKAFDFLAEDIRTNKNIILRARGRGELKRVPWYIPPPNLSKGFNAFVMDGQNNVIQSLSAPTRGELNRMKTQLLSDPDAIVNRPGFVLRDQGQVERFLDVWDVPYQGLNNAEVDSIVRGAQSKGAILSPFTENNAWEEALQSFTRQYKRLGREVTELNFKIPLDSMRARRNVVRDQRSNVLKKNEIPRRNIFDLYENTLLGKNQANDPTSRVGSLFNKGEETLNDILEGLSDTAHTLGVFGQRKGARDFEKLKAELADDFPFEKTEEFLAQRFNYKTPLSVRKITGFASKFTASLVLRYAEFAHPTLNMVGTLNTMPAVINWYTPKVGESAAAFGLRVGETAHIFPTSSGPVATMDMGKIIARGIKRTWNRKSLPNYKEMVSKGYMTQEVAEFQKLNASIGKRNDYIHRLASEGDRWLGMLSDQSENLARSWAHMTGLEVAESVLKIADPNAANVFAHDFANRVVGNYSVLNRPDLFQGGLGAPLGLFQTYMLNYYQRLYRYVETKDIQSVAIQFATQASLFGAVTVPGWEAYNDIWLSVSKDQDTDPYDGIYKRFPREFADIITTGTISNIPKFFGADSAPALFTRGDTTFRVPGGGGGVPAYQVAKDFFTMIGRGIDDFQRGGLGLNPQQLTEALGTYMPSRPISGLFELYNGFSVDRNGNVVSNEVRDGLNSVWRVMGFRPIKEARQRNAFFRNKQVDGLQLAARNRLNRASRAAVRGGNYDLLGDSVIQYLNTGGDPGYVSTWLKTTITDATQPRTERALLEALRSSTKWNQAMRLLNARTAE